MKHLFLFFVFCTVAYAQPESGVTVPLPTESPAFLIGQDADDRWDEVSKEAFRDSLGIGFLSMNSYGTDQTAIESAISDASSGSTIYFPAGDYTSAATITIDKSLIFRFDKDAKITCPVGDTLFIVDGVPFQMYGGEVIGSFDTSVNFTNSAAYVANELFFNFAYDVDTVNTIIIDNVTFRQAGLSAIHLNTDADAQIRNFTINKCRFYDCARPVTLEGVIGDSAGVENVYFTYNVIKNTKFDLDDRNGSGNGLTTNQSFRNIHIIGNRISGCGRNSIEMFSTSETAYAFYTHAIIRDNFFDYSGDRTFAAYAYDLKIINNTIRDSVDHTEIYGKSVLFEGNTVHNAPFFINTAAIATLDDDAEGWQIINNTFYYNDSRTIADANYVFMRGLRYALVSGNKFYLTGSTAVNSMTAQFGYNAYCKFVNNEIIATDKTLDGHLLSINGSIGCEYIGWKFVIDSSCTFDLASTEAIIGIRDITDCTISGTRIWNYKEYDFPGGLVRDFAGNGDSLKLAVSDGSTWTYTMIQGGRTVPAEGDSVHGYYYLVADSNVQTLTGAFATAGGQVAQWDTVGTDRWVFYTVDDYKLDLNIDYGTTLPPLVFHMPHGVAGDTLVVTDRGFINNTVTDNQFNITGLSYSTTTSNTQLMLGYSYGGKAIYYNNIFGDNDLSLLPTTTPHIFQNSYKPIYGSNFDTALYYNFGQILFYTNPITAGKIGKVCTVSGKNGTWKDFGVID